VQHRIVIFGLGEDIVMFMAEGTVYSIEAVLAGCKLDICFVELCFSSFSFFAEEVCF